MLTVPSGNIPRWCGVTCLCLLRSRVNTHDEQNGKERRSLVSILNILSSLQQRMEGGGREECKHRRIILLHSAPLVKLGKSFSSIQLLLRVGIKEKTRRFEDVLKCQYINLLDSKFIPNNTEDRIVIPVIL